MIIDKNSDSSVDLVDWLRRSSDESEQLARTNRLDSARIADVYKTTGEKLVLNITYNKSTGIMTIYYKDGSTLDIYVGTDNNLDDYVTYPDLDSAIADLESKIPSSTSDLTNDSDFVNSTQVDERIKEVVGAAPEALDTLQELGKALNNDPDFASTITNQIAEVKSLIPSVEGLASEKYVNNKVAAVEAKIPSIEGLATESYVGQTRHDIEKWVEEQGYLTEHQDISNLVTKSELAEVESKIPSIDGLASIQYVDDKVASIEIPEIDLDPYITKDEVSSNYALKSEIPSIDGLASESWVEEKIAEIQLGGDVDVTTLATKSELAAVEAKIPNIDGLASTQYVDEKIEAIEHPTIDLDPYLTKEEAEGKYAVKSDIPSLDGLATEEWVEGKGYLTEHQDISNLATKDELSSVENKIPSIEGLASQSYVDEAIANIEHPSVDLDPYLTKVDAESTYQPKGDYALKTDLVGLASETYVDEAISKIEHPDVDLTPYAKTEDVNKSISEVEAKIPSIEGLATESFVTEAIEAIEHPTVDLTPYAKKEDIPSIEGLASTQYVDDAIANIQIPEVPEVDLTSYATKTYVDEKIESIEHPSVDLDPYLTKEDAELTYATKDELPSIDGLATQTYVDEAIANIEHPTVDLTDYAKKEDIPSIEGLASETYVDEAIKSIEIPTVDLTGYATEEWVEGKGYLTEHQDISQLATISYVENKADEIEAKIPSMEPYATRAWVEETIAGMESGEVDHTVFALKTDLEGLASESYVRAQIAAIEPTDLSGLATREELSSAVEGLASTQYVDEKIEAIEHPTVDLTGYATEEWVEGKGYLTEHQDISDVVKYNTTSDGRKTITLDNHDLIQGRTTKGDTSPLVMMSKWDVADFGSKEVHANINTLSTTDIATDSEGNNIYTDGLTIFNNKAEQVDHVPVVTVNDDFALATLNHVMAIREADAKANEDKYQIKGDYAVKSDLEGLATETWVAEEIAKAALSGEIDMSAYATKDEVNSKIAALNSSFQWKDNVVSFEDIAKIYPDPEEGFSVYVDDEQTTYVYMGGEWVATGTSTDDEIPQATEELDGLMPAEAMRKLNSLENYDDSQLQGSVLSIEAQLAILADKVSALSKTNIEVVSPSMSAASFNDATKDYAIQGEVTTRFVVSGSKSISMTDTKITNDAKVTLKSTGDVELKNVYTEGEFTKTNSNCIVNIPEASSVVIKDMTVQSTQYNGIEIGLNSSILPKSVIIDNCKFDGNFSNNVISIHGVQDNAVINISNCKFSSVSNPLRLSNFTNAKNITINITNCSCDKWESGAYAGFMLCQDSTSASVEEVAINNMFSEVTINFINFTMPGGVKLTKPEDIATLCGTGNDQLIYVYANALSKADNTYVTTPYGDGSAYPTINII